MGYLAAWKVLEEMIADFRKKGIIVRAEIISSLRHARTLINVLRADPTRLDTSRKVEERLRSVESYLISEGQKRFGTEYIEEWVERLDEASSKVIEEEEEKTRFVSGLPRGQKWIRVKPSIELPLEGLKALADELNLSYDVQSDGCLLVSGKEECIRDFVKKMTMRYGVKAGKHC
jgi:hypothetical protein